MRISFKDQAPRLSAKSSHDKDCSSDPKLPREALSFQPCKKREGGTFDGGQTWSGSISGQLRGVENMGKCNRSIIQLYTIHFSFLPAFNTHKLKQYFQIADFQSRQFFNMYTIMQLFSGLFLLASFREARVQ